MQQVKGREMAALTPLEPVPGAKLSRGGGGTRLRFARHQPLSQVTPAETPLDVTHLIPEIRTLRFLAGKRGDVLGSDRAGTGACVCLSLEPGGTGSF